MIDAEGRKKQTTIKAKEHVQHTQGSHFLKKYELLWVGFKTMTLYMATLCMYMYMF